MTFPNASQALSRFTVLDLTRVRSGPTGGAATGRLGRQCHQDRGTDRCRQDGEQMGGPRHGADFQNLHRNKRAMTLNLKDPKGSAVFRRLVEKADVVVENFRPDVKKQARRSTTRTLRDDQSAPRLCQHLGLRPGRPLSTSRPGFDQIAQGMGGLMSITGAPGQGPMRVGIPVADLTAGLFCAHGRPHRAARARAVQARDNGSRHPCCRPRSSCSISRPRAG